MFNPLSVSTVYGVPDPLHGYVNLQRASGQILTNNFEQVHVRSVASADPQSGQPAVRSADAEEGGAILESLRYRSDRPLQETNTLETASPTQAAAAFRRVSDVLVADSWARDPANRVKTINVFA